MNISEANRIVYNGNRDLSGTPITDEEFEALGVDPRFANHVPDSWADEVRDLLTRWRESDYSEFIKIAQVKEKFCTLRVYYDKVEVGPDDPADLPNVAAHELETMVEAVEQKLVDKGVYPYGVTKWVSASKEDV